MEQVPVEQLIGRLLLILGLGIALMGGLLILIGKGWIGHLPGDIHIERENFSCSIPIVTSILLSILLTIVLNLIARLLR